VPLGSAWGDLARALAFEAGWWSAGTWIASVSALALTMVPVAVARNDLWLGAAFFAGPLVTVIFFGLLSELADPEPGCTYDCTGRLVLLGPLAGILIGWAIGYAVGLGVYLGRRGTSPRDRS